MAQIRSKQKRQRLPVAWELVLYVAGQSPQSQHVFRNLKRIGDTYLPGQYHIRVVDVLLNPQLICRQSTAGATPIRKNSTGRLLASSVLFHFYPAPGTGPAFHRVFHGTFET